MPTIRGDFTEFGKWIATRPQIIKDLAKKYPPDSIFDVDGETYYLVGYNEGGALLVSKIDPFKDYQGALDSAVAMCAEHFTPRSYQ